MNDPMNDGRREGAGREKGREGRQGGRAGDRCESSVAFLFNGRILLLLIILTFHDSIKCFIVGCLFFLRDNYNSKLINRTVEKI